MLLMLSRNIVMRIIHTGMCSSEIISFQRDGNTNLAGLELAEGIAFTSLGSESTYSQYA
jgi:hypothetical protein